MKKLKPFDLKTALKGEPVILRNGSKAYVRHHETELKTEIGEDLLGYVLEVGLWSWCVDGASRHSGHESQYDIIGMWPPKTRIINGFEVPAPETEAPKSGTRCCLASLAKRDFYFREVWSDNPLDMYLLERGLVFLNKDDAIANAKAMLGIDPDKPSVD